MGVLPLCELRATALEVNDVEQETRIGIPGRDGDVCAVRERTEYLVGAPQLRRPSEA